MTRFLVTEPRLVGATPEQVRTGLLGFVSFTIGGILRIDGVTARRTRDGRLALSWPERRDRAGVAHPILRPVDDGARRILEVAVLDALGLIQAEAPDVP